MTRIITSNLIVLAFIFMNAPCHAQEMLSILPLNKNTNKIEYAEVVQVSGTSAELYTRALMWINTFYKNASSVTKVRDENNGIIEGQHRIRLMNKIEDGTEMLYGYIQYNIKLEFKEGRYRYIFNEFVSVEMSRQPIERWQNPKDTQHTANTLSHLQQIDVFMKDMIVSLKKGMEPKVEVKDEW